MTPPTLSRDAARPTRRQNPPTENAWNAELPDANAALFLALLRHEGLPQPHREYCFAYPSRKWRFDFAWPAFSVALEVDGGLFVRGRHTRGAAILKTHEKLNAAALDGWRLLYCTPETLCDLLTIAMLKKILVAPRYRRCPLIFTKTGPRLTRHWVYTHDRCRSGNGRSTIGPSHSRCQPRRTPSTASCSALCWAFGGRNCHERR